MILAPLNITDTMKKLTFVIIFMTVFLNSFSQLEYAVNKQPSSIPVHVLGDLSFSGSGSVLLHTPNGVQLAGGFKMRLFMGKRISFDTDILFGRDYIHAGPGLFGIPVWILFLGGTSDETTFSEELFYYAVMALSAEHISYHIPCKNNLDISPYISLLRYKSAYEFEKSPDRVITEEQLSFAVGLEINKYYKRFVLSPYIEYNIGYTDHIPGINAGVYCGIYFPNKRIK
jgi:hypothetical protein